MLKHILTVLAVVICLIIVFKVLIPILGFAFKVFFAVCVIGGLVFVARKLL